MIRVVFVLKAGADFEMRHACKAADSVHRHLRAPHECVVLTDSRESLDGYRGQLAIVPLETTAPGWWAMIEMFRVPGTVLYLDLDVAITGPLDPLAERIERLSPNEIIMIRSWNKAYTGSQWCTGLTAWNGDRTWIYEQFKALMAIGIFGESKCRPDDGLLRAGYFRVRHLRYPTDEYWTPQTIEKAGETVLCVKDVLPGYMQSYKYDLNHGTKQPTGSIVMFHGKPRPWEVGW